MPSNGSETITLTVTREDLARLIAQADGHDDPDEMVSPMQMPGDPPGGRPSVPAWQKHGLALAYAIFDVRLRRSEADGL